MGVCLSVFYGVRVGLLFSGYRIARAVRSLPNDFYSGDWRRSNVFMIVFRFECREDRLFQE